MRIRMAKNNYIFQRDNNKIYYFQRESNKRILCKQKIRVLEWSAKYYRKLIGRIW